MRINIAYWERNFKAQIPHTTYLPKARVMPQGEAVSHGLTYGLWEAPKGDSYRKSTNVSPGKTIL
jgi:hypothetical protein